MKKICLNMIVKNESKIITRLFDSVANFIDTYCICDTGSTDNTVEVIENYFKDRKIPGFVIHKDFVNFGFNRTYSLQQARLLTDADYALLLDADMVLKIGDFDKSRLDKDVYSILQGSQAFNYYNIRLVSLRLDVVVRCPTHEYYDIKDPYTKENLSKSLLFIEDLGDGGCKTNKYTRDIELLTKGIEEEPSNTRYHFYLANSYYDTNQLEQAVKYYLKHIEISNWDEEKFYSHYRLGQCYLKMDKEMEAVYYLMKSFQVRPSRIEGIFELIQYFKNKSQHHLVDLYYQKAKQVKYPVNDSLFVHKDIYDWKLDYEYSVSAYYLGNRDLSHFYFSLMNRAPSHMFWSIINNYKYYKAYIEPVKSINQSQSVSKVISLLSPSREYKMKSSSSSIISVPGEDYLYNIRYVNYHIDRQGRYSYGKSTNFDQQSCTRDQIITMNQRCRVGRELDIKTSHMYSITETNPNLTYYGVEDVKLFYHEYLNKVLYTGTAYHNQICIAYGTYDLTEGLSPIYLKKQGQASVEKNWVFVPNNKNSEIRMIYKWNPLTIGKLENDDNSSEDTSLSLKIISEIQMPEIFHHVRGSTNGVRYNDEIWFVTHLVGQNGGEARYYYHMLVVFDSEMNFKRCTVPFQFGKDQQIQYCLGLIVEPERIIITHSNWDRETHMGVYAHETFEKLWERKDQITLVSP